jgi:hypothetical protein
VLWHIAEGFLSSFLPLVHCSYSLSPGVLHNQFSRSGEATNYIRRIVNVRLCSQHFPFPWSAQHVSLPMGCSASDVLSHGEFLISFIYSSASLTGSFSFLPPRTLLPPSYFICICVPARGKDIPGSWLVCFASRSILCISIGF